jgi:hypothetical protein
MKRTTWILATVMLAGAVACGGDDKAPETVADTPKMSPGDDAGDAHSPPCNVAAGGCTGVTDNQSLGNPRVAARFVKALDDHNAWDVPSGEIARRTTDGNLGATLLVRTIKGAKNIALKNVANFSVVMGRIDVVSISSTERFFGISPQDAELAQNRFYLIVSTFKKKPQNQYSVPISTWRLYGVTKAGVLRPFGESRELSYCLHKHDDQSSTARFTQCKTAARVHEIMAMPAFAGLAQATGPVGTILDLIRGATPDSASLSSGASRVGMALGRLGVDPAAVGSDVIAELAQLLLHESEDPFWLTCGVGCCTTGGT